MNEASRAIARISTTVTFDDGTLMTWTADDPLRPSFEVSGLLPELGPVSPEALYRIPEPEPVSFAVSFQANFRQCGLVFTAIPPGSAVTVHRGDLARLAEIAREAGEGRDGAVIRARSAAGLPPEAATP